MYQQPEIHHEVSITNKEEKPMLSRIISFICKHPREGLQTYPGLTRFNGQAIFSNEKVWSNIEVNGQAMLSGGAKFKDVLLVNGEMNADDCTFDVLDVRGSFKVNKAVINNQGFFYGSGKIQNSQIACLGLRSPGKIVLENTHVKGDLEYTSDGYRSSRLVLDNTTIDGVIFADESDREKVRFMNGSPVVPFKSRKKN